MDGFIRCRRRLIRTKVIALDFDYVVLNTGYLSRVVSYFLNQGYTFNLTHCKTDLEDVKGGFKRDAAKDRLIGRQPLAAVNPNQAESGTRKEADMYRREYRALPEWTQLDPETDNQVERADMPLFLVDTLFGEGVYTCAEADAKDVALVQKCVLEFEQQRNETEDMDLTGAIAGTIAFRCTSFARALRIASHLATLRFCGCFDPIDPIHTAILESTGKRVLFLEFDTESG